MYLSAPQTVSYVDIPDGRDGVIVTLKYMRQFARDASRDISFRNLALNIIEDVPEKDWAAQAHAIHDYVRDHIKYVMDVDGVEFLQTPQRLLESRAGDCDDKTTLAAALLLTLGHPVRFVAVGFSGGDLSHVYLETKMQGRWFASDTTEPQPFGWHPPAISDRVTMSV